MDDERQREPGIGLAVTTPGPIAPGSDVEVRVTVPELDAKVAAARVELVRVDAARNTRKRDVLARAPLWDGEPQAGTATARLAVPQDAAPTVDGLVSWAIVAVVDRGHGLDAQAAEAITVGPPPGLPQRAARPAESGVDGECAFAFEGVRRTVRPGETLTGRLLVTPAKDVKKATIVMKLVERIAFPDGDPAEREVVRELAAEDVSLRAGQRHAFAFSLALPADARPVYETEHSALHWLLRGCVERPGFWRADWDGALELNVAG